MKKFESLKYEIEFDGNIFVQGRSSCAEFTTKGATKRLPEGSDFSTQEWREIQALVRKIGWKHPITPVDGVTAYDCDYNSGYLVGGSRVVASGAAWSDVHGCWVVYI